MQALDWQETAQGYRCPGYSLTVSGRCWRLAAPGSAVSIQSGEPPAVSVHRSADEAMAWAEHLEIEELDRIGVRLHAAVAAAALVALIVLAEAIGSLLGLTLVAAAFYVTLRSAANAIGLLLRDAWGWTRPGPSRLGVLERLVGAAARLRRARMLKSVAATAATVRPLDPVA